MSLFGRRNSAPVQSAVRGWHPDGTGITSEGDSAGGDIQRGDSYSVRFICDDIPGSLVTVTFYAAEPGEDSGGYVVQRQIEWMVCEDPADPGGTEIWSDVEYDDTVLPDWASLAIAEAEARRNAGIALAFDADDISWNGHPFRNGARS
jgi:hypothetical protein